MVYMVAGKAGNIMNLQWGFLDKKLDLNNYMAAPGRAWLFGFTSNPGPGIFG